MWRGRAASMVVVLALVAGCATAAATDHLGDRPGPAPTSAAPTPSTTSTSPPAAETTTTTIAAPSPSPGEEVDCDATPCVALTFDDGPAPSTPRLLDLLAAEGVPATFFLVGSQIEAHPDIARRVRDEGHEIANHTWSHPKLTAIGVERAREEVRRGAAAIEGATGVTPTLLRAPQGAMTAELRAALGWPMVGWDVDTEDWLHRDPVVTTLRVVDQTEPGSIVLLHDVYDTTVDAVPGIISELRARGFTFVTATDLLGPGLTADETYGRRPRR